MDKFADACRRAGAVSACFLACDGMDILACLSADFARGLIWGLIGNPQQVDRINVAELLRRDLATHANFWVLSSGDGIVKRTISVQFTARLTGAQLIEHFQQIFSEIRRIGHALFCFSSDHAAANDKLLTWIELNIGAITLVDTNHLLKCNTSHLRTNPNFSYSLDGVNFSLQVIVELQLEEGLFPDLSLDKDIFPTDRQKVSPLLKLLATHELLSQRPDPRAQKLGSFFGALSAIHRAFDVLRTCEVCLRPFLVRVEFIYVCF